MLVSGVAGWYMCADIHMHISVWDGGGCGVEGVGTCVLISIYMLVSGVGWGGCGVDPVC